jgi:hypothetical protein
VVHIASHFIFVGGSAASSYLLLGDGGRLSLAEMASAGYRFDRTELVTLSACETGLSEVDRYGLEIDGLGALLIGRGAPSVLASMWKVDDAGTAMMMAAMYACEGPAARSNGDDAWRGDYGHFTGHARRNAARSSKQITRLGRRYGRPVLPSLLLGTFRADGALAVVQARLRCRYERGTLWQVPPRTPQPALNWISFGLCRSSAGTRDRLVMARSGTRDPVLTYVRST